VESVIFSLEETALLPSLSVVNIQDSVWWCRVVSGITKKNSTSPYLLWMLYKATKGLTALPPELDCKQMAMGLPRLTSAVFLKANSAKLQNLGGILEMFPAFEERDGPAVCALGM
jgi:hypothetical protein